MLRYTEVTDRTKTQQYSILRCMLLLLLPDEDLNILVTFRTLGRKSVKYH